MPKQFHQWVLCAVLATALAGCGGTTSPNDDNSSDDKDAPGNTSEQNSHTNNRIGSLNTAGNFIPNVIDASRTTLEAGETAHLSVMLVDADDHAITTPVEITFTSNCTQDDLATITPTRVTTRGGRASVTYTPHGCSGQDTIVAKAALDDITLQASVVVETHAAAPASIVFVGAQPSQIGLIGSGGTLPKQSRVTFRLTSPYGSPASNQLVTFDLSTQAGGIQLSRTRARTNTKGQASTTVTSGSVPTSVRVIASTTARTGQTLTAVSSALAITTGRPDNDSFTLSAQTLNIEGWRYAGMQSTLTVFLADRFNNPVPDGTAVTFTAEGGAVDSSCLTQDGQCSVTFRSQQPRPANGRVTILATATGEESFIDTNGNGRYDTYEPFQDLPEAYVDRNENGAHDAAEWFVDANHNQAYSLGNHRFNGLLCQSGCARRNTATVRDSIVIVLSGSLLQVDIRPESISLDNGATSVTVTVHDKHGQVAPSGTTIQAKATQGHIIGPAQFTQKNTNKPVTRGGSVGHFTFKLNPVSKPGNGVFRVTVTTPKGHITRAAADITQTTAP